MRLGSFVLLGFLATFAHGQLGKIAVTFVLDNSIRTFENYFSGEYDAMKTFVQRFAEGFGLGENHRISVFNAHEKLVEKKIPCNPSETLSTFLAQLDPLKNDVLEDFYSAELVHSIGNATENFNTGNCGTTSEGFAHYIVLLTTGAQLYNDPIEQLLALYSDSAVPPSYVFYKDEGQAELTQFGIIVRGDETKMRLVSDYAAEEHPAYLLSKITSGGGGGAATYGEWGDFSECGSNCLQTRVRTCESNCGNAHTSETIQCQGDQCSKYEQWSAFTTCNSECEQTRTRGCNYDCDDAIVSETSKCTGGLCQTTYGEWGDFSKCGSNCLQTRVRTCESNCGNVVTSETIQCQGEQCVPQFGQWSGYTTCNTECRKTRTRVCNYDCFNAITAETIDCEGGNCRVLGEWSDFGICTVNCQRSRTRTCNGDCEFVQTQQFGACTGGQCFSAPTYTTWGAWGKCEATCLRYRSRECVRSCSQAVLTDEQACTGGACGASQTLTQWSAFSDCTESCNRNDPYRERTRSCSSTELCDGEEVYQTTPCNREFACPEMRQSDWGEWTACSATCRYENQIPFRVRRRDYCLEQFNTGLCAEENMVQYETCNVDVCLTVETCETLQVSFIIVMDSSTSVDDTQWEQEKQFVKNFIGKSELGENPNVRVGVVNYGSYAKVVAGCGEVTSKEQFNNLIDNTPKQGGGTAINSGLIEAQRVYKNCNRDNEHPVVLLLTDGFENIETDTSVMAATEASIKSEATLFVIGVTSDVIEDEIIRIGTQKSHGKTEELYQLVDSFLDLSNIDPEKLYPIVLGASCKLKGTWGAWFAWSNCSHVCGATGTQVRQRQCSNVVGPDCDTQGTIAKYEVHTCFAECSTFYPWSAWSACSASCRLASGPPEQSRSRACNNVLGACIGHPSETRECNTNVPCQGQLTSWAGFGACSASCQLTATSVPFKTRERSCLQATLTGNCNREPIQDIQECNQDVRCEGIPGGWSNWGACSETCNTAGPGPFQTRVRECTQYSDYQEGYAGCDNKMMSEERTCNQGQACPGNYGQWGDWNQCSHTCHIGAENDPPTRTRMRVCSGSSLGGGCVGESFQTQACNFKIPCPAEWSTCSEICHSSSDVQIAPTQFRSCVCAGDTLNGGCEGEQSQSRDYNFRVPCPGALTLWGAWSSCPMTCQMELFAPTHVRQRQCIGATWGGDCGENTKLTESKSCSVEIRCPGTLTQWSEYGECEATCKSEGAGPYHYRSRTCINYSTWVPNYEGCPGAERQQQSLCNERIPCPGEYQPWSPWSTCSETCHSSSDVQSAPTQFRSRVCAGDTLNGGCEGEQSQSRDCNFRVPCPGALTLWGAWSSCPMTCQMELFAPIHVRQRQCIGATWGGDCGENTKLTESKSCSVEIRCPGTLTQWSEYGECEATCKSEGAGPYHYRSRTCINYSTWVPNYEGCPGAERQQQSLCNERIPCPGEYQPWSIWSTCSETCHSSSDVQSAPTQFRSRICAGDTLNGGCEGEQSQSRDCNFEVPCPGALTLWGAWSSCPMTCQMELFAPTHVRQRQCIGSTWGGDCGENTKLTESKSCSVEIRCPGTLTQWSEYGECEATCKSEGAGPYHYRSRTCINYSTWVPNYEGCPGAERQQQILCNQLIPCPGEYQPWGEWSQCSESCQSSTDPNNYPFHTRTRVCEGDTLNGGCEGDSSETKSCNDGVACPGILTQWTNFIACSHTCHPNNIEAPTRSRSRQCISATLGANCNGAPLQEVETCNVEEPCQGNIAQWSEWSACPETCQPGPEKYLKQFRSRVCQGTSWGGNCFGQSIQDDRRCVENVPCPGILTEWSQYTECSESCQSELDVFPTQSRTRQCLTATLGANCGGAILDEVVECNKEKGCPGVWSEWGPFTKCSHTCQQTSELIPTRSRQRFCTGRTFDGVCPSLNNIDYLETVECNKGIICPEIGIWSKWSDWSECSVTCDKGVTQRVRTCSTPFPVGAGNDCEEDSMQEQVCNLGDCPKVCPIPKRCSCDAVQVWNYVPTFDQFQTSGLTVAQVNAAVKLMHRYTPEYVEQACQECNKMRLAVAIEEIKNDLEQVRLVIDRLQVNKEELRDVLNCNQVIGNYVGLWELYDYMYERCALIEGLEIEMQAVLERYAAAQHSCESYGWFHSLYKRVWRKDSYKQENDM